MKNKRIFF